MTQSTTTSFWTRGRQWSAIVLSLFIVLTLVFALDEQTFKDIGYAWPMLISRLGIYLVFGLMIGRRRPQLAAVMIAINEFIVLLSYFGVPTLW